MRSDRTWVWRGFRVDLPADWEMLQYSLADGAGRCAFADRYRFRAEVSWRHVPGAPDFERMMGDYASRLLEGDAGEVARLERGGWPGLRSVSDGLWTSRYGRYLPRESMLIELVFITAGSPASREEERVLASFAAAEPGHWKAFGLDVTAPAGMALRECRAEPAHSELTFGAKGRGRCSFACRGMVSEWLKTSVSDWLVEQAVGVRDLAHGGARTVHGHVIESLRGTARRRTWLGRRAPYEAHAWTCPVNGRLYSATWDGVAVDGSAGLACGCGAGNAVGLAGVPAARPDYTGAWGRTLAAVPVRNDAARAEGVAGVTRVFVKNRRPGYMVPPVSWVVPFKPERCTELDALGTLVWNLCDGRRNFEAVVGEFAGRHGLSFHEARVAVTQYATSLVRRGALAVVMPEGTQA